MQAKIAVKELTSEMVGLLLGIQNNTTYDNTPPPHGKFICSAPAILVSLLNGRKTKIMCDVVIFTLFMLAKRNEGRDALTKEEIMERASAISEEQFEENPTNHGNYNRKLPHYL